MFSEWTSPKWKKIRAYGLFIIWKEVKITMIWEYKNNKIEN
jgi:hypothetical protein